MLDNMIHILGGTFMMGEKGSQKQVTLDSFSMDKYPVTQKEYERVMGTNPSRFKGPNLPVENVNWFEAQEYCKKVDKRLPTEAEWEYACRAGSTTDYYWGDEFDGDYCWYGGNSNKKTHSVGEKKLNAFGLYDMVGNVWEWCSDIVDKDFRMLRGGSCGNDDYDVFRSAYRNYNGPYDRIYFLGFRAVRSAPEIIIMKRILEKGW